MPALGLSPLEIKHLIERALLPDRCDFSEQDGLLTLRLTQKKYPHSSVTIHASIAELHTSRAIAELVGKARYSLAHTNAQMVEYSVINKSTYK